MKKIALIVAIPFIVLCLLIVRAEYHLKVGEQWDIELTGYDPRDLLRGHYLRLRLNYDWNKDLDNNSSDTSYCLCLRDIGNQAPQVSKTDCSLARSYCDGFIRSEFEQELDRFYIPETQARKAEDLLRKARRDNKAYLRLSINKKGEPRIVDLLIDGESLHTLLAKDEVTETPQ